MDFEIPEYKYVALPQHYNLALLDEIRHFESYVFKQQKGSGWHANLSLTTGVRNAVPLAWWSSFHYSLTG
jgi:hypothetical protein